MHKYIGNKKMPEVELMSPCGDFSCLQAAIENGANSIYFGVEQLNMRARSSINFTIDDLKEIQERCSSRNIRTYLAINTIVYDHDLSIVRRLLKAVKENKITAIIAMDQAVIATAREMDIEVHISTQLNITNIETVKFYSMFADTVVLSRELSLRQVKYISNQIERQNIKGPSGRLVEIEIFVHGALCMAVSGKCYLSLHSHNSSANRGACKQNCRKKYVVTDKESGFEIEIDNEYMMSPKDLCTIGFLDQIVSAGAKVLKIEGRGRSPEYVSTVTKVYREALDSIYQGDYSSVKIIDWENQLKKVYNRGFWDGYYLGRKLGQWSEVSGSQSTQKKVFIGKGINYFDKTSIAEFYIEAYDIKLGDKLLLIGPTIGVIEFQLEEMWVNDEEKDIALKGDSCTIKTDFKVRRSDKLYKIVSA